jgi:hypothetical protein
MLKVNLKFAQTAFAALTLTAISFAVNLLADFSSEVKIYCQITLLSAIVGIFFVTNLKKKISDTDWFQPLYVVGFLILLMYVVFPLYLGTQQWNSRMFRQAGYTLQQRTDALALAVHYVAAGTCFIGLGYLWPTSRQAAKAIPPVHPGTNTKINFLIIFLALMVCAAIWAFWVIANGGFEFLKFIFTHASEYRNGLLKPRLALLRVSQMFIIGLTPLLLAVKTPRTYSFTLKPIFALAALLIAYITFLSVSTTLFYILAIILVFNYRVKKLSLHKVIIAFLLLVILAVFLKFSYSMSGNWSAERFVNYSKFLLSTKQDIFYYTIGHKMKGADVLAVALQSVPEKLDYLSWHGVYLGIVKALPTSIIPQMTDFESIGNQFSSVIVPQKAGGNNMTFFGFLYIIAGLPAIITGSFIYGVIAATIYQWFKNNKDNQWSIAVYALTLTYGLAFFMRTGQLGLTLQRTGYNVIAFILLAFLSRELNFLIKTKFRPKND